MAGEPEPIAVVGLSAIMPDAPDAARFWANITSGRYCISDVPPGRWDPSLYYDPDPLAPGKSYSRIGGWVRDFDWDPLRWRLPLPPAVAAQLDIGQQWAVAASRVALLDAGWPQWTVDPDRVAVIIGNAIGGEKHYWTNLHIEYPQFTQALCAASSFAALPGPVRQEVLAQTREAFFADFPGVTEDTMPGELSNIIAGRVANLFNFRGANYTTDAACASGLAAVSAAMRGLQAHDYDVAITGGVDRNMGVSAFVKFCKIGALSATGTRPFDADADGFVMGEGAAVFILKRLSDAERSGDRIYALMLGVAGSSDGKGKGITAPNPIGQRLAVERAWSDAGIDPARAGYIEGHGTSTRVGDASELASLTDVFAKAGASPGSIALGSVKSNVGHLKAAAGAAGLFKLVMSLHEKVLAPSLNFVTPNPNVAWAQTPFRVNTELRAWPVAAGNPRVGGVSAFGFGGTNFHLVLAEYQPGRYERDDAPRSYATSTLVHERKPPLRGVTVAGGADNAEVAARLRQIAGRAGDQPDAFSSPTPPDPNLGEAEVRVAIDHADVAELAARAIKAADALSQPGSPGALWRMLRSQGIFLGRGAPGKVAFLYTGQGSQYVNMLRELRDREPIVAELFTQADRVMSPLLGQPLSDYIFVAPGDRSALERAEHQLLQTEITQPAVLTVDLALTNLLDAYDVRPDMVMGHSLGEYGALVAAGSLSFAAALEAVSARGREMAQLSVEDNGAMAAVFGPLDQIEHILNGVDGYVVIANINSTGQAVIGGARAAVAKAVTTLQAAGLTARPIPVSHAFHTSIVAPVSGALMAALRRLDIRPPRLPIVSNVTGEFYPSDADVSTVLDLLGRQVAAPVQFVRGLRTLYDAGARVFVEVGPKRALHGFVEDVLGAEHDDVLALFTNHPKLRDDTAINQALCGLYAAGVALRRPASAVSVQSTVVASAAAPARPQERSAMNQDRYAELGQIFARAIEAGLHVYHSETDPPAPARQAAPGTGTGGAADHDNDPVVITGAALGLPGVSKVFDDGNLARILAGQQFIDAVPHRFRRTMVEHRITRLVKPAAGEPTFATIDSEADVIKLAARRAPFDVVSDFGVDPARDEALDITTRLAIGAGFDALRDAGIPLVMRYKTTTLGTQIPDRWGLPEPMRDDTGVVFASAFPGYDNFAGELERFFTDRAGRDQLAALQAVRARMRGDEPAVAEVDRRIDDLSRAIATQPYLFDRRFLFRALSMGHAQFAEIIGARGPNTQINAACASTTQAICVAEDWIRAGRCRRVIVISADDATSDNLLPWICSGFLASGAAATDDLVEDAATPFDRRRHGLIVGMGAAAIVVEAAEAARERSIQPICEVLSATTANSAYHGTRLDVEHIAGQMEVLIRKAEARGINRQAIAPELVFVSHETYTPARGGSAAAEITALRRVFGADAQNIVITNTKGFTGHAMGAGIEDVVGIKALETGIVPPVPNFAEPDPELGSLNLSLGGAYPVGYALRLAAGFGSQIAMALLRRSPTLDGRRRSPAELGYAYRIVDPAAWQHWLDTCSGHPQARLEVSQRRLRIVDEIAAPAEIGAPAPVVVATPEQVVVATPEPVVVATPEPVVVATPEPVVVVASKQAAGADEVATAVVEIVAGLTGYPPELLDRDLDMEADLGVDTVKQAEVFAAVRQRFGLDRDDSLRLRDFPTLNHVIGWVQQEATAQPPSVDPVAVVPTSQPTPTRQAASDDVASAVVGIVSGLTGYPPELLDLDLELEADLGVDTVKQAEVFSAVRQRFGLQRDENLQLRDFPTLNHVVDWIRDRTGAIEPGFDHAPTEVPTEVGAAPGQPRTPAADELFPARVVIPALRPSLELCVPTGVALNGASKVVVMLDRGGVGEELVTRLTELEVATIAVEPGVDAQDICRRIGPARVDGVYWLAALDDEGPIAELDIDGWREALRHRVGALHATMRHLYPHLPFLITGTRMGGYHGYDDGGATCPLGGAVTGFAKAYRKELPNAVVKAVDLRLDGSPGETARVHAQRLLEETLRDPACVEVGYANGQRWGVALAERPSSSVMGGGAGEQLSLGEEPTFLVTGAAGGIVSAITADLAAVSRGTFHLLDLSPAPDPASVDLRRFVEDRDGLKRDLAERLRLQGERPTPVLIDQQLARLERQQAAQSAIEAIEKAGGSAHYYSVDLTDPLAVAEVLQRVRAVSDHIDILLHAAGVEISHPLPEKSPDEFALVFDVKANGWFNLMRAVGDLPVGTTVAFSSVAARFGNAGQADYSAANDLLCKLTSNQRRTRPEIRSIALDWTAWAGAGMASRGSIPQIMAAAGVQTLPATVGPSLLRREIAAQRRHGEVVVAGALGEMATEYHHSGGLVDNALAGCGGPMVGDVVASVHSGLTVRTTLDPKRLPFLDHHRIDGVPVLPGVMGIEAFAEAARLLTPQWHIAAVEDMQFLAPVKFYRDEPRTLTITALIRPDADDVIADCTLSAERALPGTDLAQRSVHFTGRVRLTQQPQPAASIEVPQRVNPCLTAADIYRLYFHGPAYQVIASAWRHADGAAASFAHNLPAQCDDRGTPMVVAPRLIELCLQTAGLWEAGTTARLALPQRIERLALLGDPVEPGEWYAVARAVGDGFEGTILDATGRIAMRLEGYRTVALPQPLPDDVRRPIHTALAG